MYSEKNESDRLTADCRADGGQKLRTAGEHRAGGGLPEYNGGTDMRIGQGYDVHRLTEGRKLILGGVTMMVVADLRNQRRTQALGEVEKRK